MFSGERTKNFLGGFLAVFLLAALSACAFSVPEGFGALEGESVGDSEAKPEETGGLAVGEEELPDHLTWYYTRLSGEEQTLYLQMYVILRDRLDFTEVDCPDGAALSGILEYVLLDNPELYYVENISTQYTTVDGEITSMKITGTENMEESELEEAGAKIEAFAAEAYSGVTEEMTEYEIALYLYDYVIDRISYNTEAPYNQSLYSAALGESVCKGYACAFQYLCNGAGIDCICVHGTLNGQEHAWNMVLLDGQWCHVDCTAGEDLTESFGITDYAWFGLSDEWILESHACSEPELLPAAESMENSYFVRSGCYFLQADEERLVELMESGEDFAFQCDTQDVYEEMYAILLNGERIQDVLRSYGNGSIKYGRIDTTRTVYLFFVS